MLVLTADGLEEQAETLLAPFDENREVPEYETSCWCVGVAAKQRVYNRLFEESAFERARLEFSQRPDVKMLIQESIDAGNHGFSPEIDALWDELFNHPFEKRIVEHLDAEPDKNSPDPECPSCSGTGVERTTYNPQAKWDSYEYDNEWVDLFRPVQGLTAEEFLEYASNLEQPYLTLAVLTPNGEWLEKGEVLNNGFLKNAMSSAQWQDKFVETLRKFPTAKVMIYDCHI